VEDPGAIAEEALDLQGPDDARNAVQHVVLGQDLAANGQDRLAGGAVARGPAHMASAMTTIASRWFNRTPRARRRRASSAATKKVSRSSTMSVSRIRLS